MNILICSAGRRVALVEYFKKELHKLNGKVVVVDCDPTAPALHHADEFEIVPRINHKNYIQSISDICKKYRINGILTLIDPELDILATHKHEFEKKNITVLCSNKDVVNICIDKYMTYKFLQDNNIPGIPTYSCITDAIKDIENQKLSLPLIIKPRKGSASIGIHKITSFQELKDIKFTSNDFIVQPFIDGEEFGVDCYVDLDSKQTTNIFMKKKVSMRAGETDKSISVKDPNLKMLIEKLLDALKPIGPVDIDCFKTETGYVISEINPRFGGGYPHAHEMGQNFIKNILNNLKGESNIPIVEDYKVGTTMVKYDHIILL